MSGLEIFREYGPDGAVTLERETLHVFDDKHRLALIENRTIGTDQGPGELIRYQLANHLDSSVLELDQDAQVISYEEFYPYGSTAYQAVRASTETPKRYRYTGKERDTETGLYYHGARYYVPWLARWLSPDPAGLIDGTNLYRYVRNNPLRLTDSTGKGPDDDIKFSNGGKMSRVEMAPHVDEADAVAGNRAGGVAGSPSDPANKQFLDPRTNSVSKKNFVSNAPSNSRPSVSIANSPEEAANRILTGRFSEVDELRELADDATARTRPGLRTNSTLRASIKKNPALRSALSSIGINPDTLKAENPPGKPQFSGSGSVNFSRVDADLDPATGRVVPGPNTSAALARRASPPPPAGAPAPMPPPAEPPAPLPRVTPPNPPAAAPQSAWRAAASSAIEGGGKLLRFAGKVFTVYGAANEADRTYDLEMRNNRGYLNAGLMWASTAVAGVLAGAVDDALGAATIEIGSAPVIQSWDDVGAGPTQHLAGEAIRAFLDWGAHHGL